MFNITSSPASRQPGNEAISDFGLIGNILDELRHDELIAKPNEYRWTGRRGYPPAVMWRATLVRYLRRLQYTGASDARLLANAS